MSRLCLKHFNEKYKGELTTDFVEIVDENNLCDECDNTSSLQLDLDNRLPKTVGYMTKKDDVKYFIKTLSISNEGVNSVTYTKDVEEAKALIDNEVKQLENYPYYTIATLKHNLEDVN